jgi:hypothetical protein
VAAKVAGDPAADSAASAPDAASNEVEPASPEPILLIGVPLFAAALLMGIYWLILRIGAV